MAESSVQRRSLETPYQTAVDMKGPATVTMAGDKPDADSISSASWEGHGEHDKRDMERLGKKQEFKRNFGFWSALGFVGEWIVEAGAEMFDSV